jgi:competence protein ComEA
VATPPGFLFIELGQAAPVLLKAASGRILARITQGTALSYGSVAIGCIVTLMVAGTCAAQVQMPLAQAATATQAPANTTPGKPATTPASTPPKMPTAFSSTAQKQPAPKPADGAPTTTQKSAAPAKPEKKVDINNASLAELKTLPMVGDAEAKKIIANRPFTNKTDLVVKAGLPEGVYTSIKNRIVLRKPVKTAPKT